MKIGIVGGTGNISTAIVRLLLQRGHAVVCFNRGQAGAPPAGARVLRGDRHATAAFEQAMQAEKFDAAIDMLCFNAADAASAPSAAWACLCTAPPFARTACNRTGCP